MYQIEKAKKGMKDLSELIGWRNQSSIAEDFETNSQTGAAWSSQRGLDVERIYEEMNNSTDLPTIQVKRVDGSPQHLRCPSIADKVSGLISNAGTDMKV